MKNNTILHITTTYLPDHGGTINRIRNLISPIIKIFGYEFHILIPTLEDKSSGEKLPERETISDITIHRVNGYGKIRNALRRLYKIYNFGIIHSHNPRLTLPVMLSGIRVPVIAEIHSLHELSFLKFIAARWGYRRAKHIIVLSQRTKEKVAEIYGIKKSKISVICNGIGASLLTLPVSDELIRKKYGLKDNFVAGYTGSFYNWQGVEILMDAIPFVLEHEPDTQFLLAGDGPLWGMCRHKIEAAGLSEKVILTGWVPHEEIPNYLDAMDVVLMPRPSTLATETTIPLKLLEAMARARPILATRVGGFTEILEDKKNACLIEPGCSESLADGIIELKRNADLRRQIAAEGKKLIEAWHTWEQSARALVEIYDQFL
ncbi:MAG: glycosyltransferase family 4 protein [bacterium]